MATRDDVVRVARSYLNTPFHHLGRMPGVALDCGGFIICALRKIGAVATDFDVPSYCSIPDGRMRSWCDRYMGGEIKQADMRPGDAILLISEMLPQHLAILGDYRHGGLSIIHASNVAHPPRVIETRLMFSKNLQFVAAYRLPGIS